MMVHLNNQFVLYISPSLYSLQYLIHVKLTITRTAVAFQKNGSFAGCVLWRINGACVDTKPRSIEATCTIDVMTLYKHMLLVQTTKTLVVASK